MNLVVENPLSNIDFKSYYNLRWEILRKPLGGNFSSCFDQYEFNSFHAICRNVNDGLIIGVGRIHSIDKDTQQIRYMAVHEKYRRMKVGNNILYFLEKYAKENKKKYIILYARESALNFYINNSYKICKKAHLLYGEIQHYLMKKKLK